jgi:hypothetical protein
MLAPALDFVPAWQGVEVVAPVGQAEPAGHIEQSLELAALVVVRNVPLAHN